MKKFRNTLAIMALATVAMFSAQTALAQSLVGTNIPTKTFGWGNDDETDDDGNLPETPTIPLHEPFTLTTVYPNGTSASLTCDFTGLYLHVFCNRHFREVIKQINALGKPKPDVVYQKFMEAGLDESSSWLMSQWYKIQPNLFSIVQ